MHALAAPAQLGLLAREGDPVKFSTELRMSTLLVSEVRGSEGQCGQGVLGVKGILDERIQWINDRAEVTGIQWSRVTNEDKTREYYYD